MIKKINTEKDIPTQTFKVKMGTTDKKNPEIIYIQAGVYIKSTEEKKTYSNDVNEIRKGYKSIIKDMTLNNEIFKDCYIATIDICSERISTNKKSYITFEFYLKQNNVVLDKERLDFVNSVIKECIDNDI